MQKSDSIKMEIYVSWFILAIFYLYQYILRISPGILIEEIRQDFHMNADQFAMMGAMGGYGYSLMQVPLGILIDRVGIRTIALWSITLCVLGTFLLTISHDHVVAYFSRFIIGLGAASAFMSSLKIASDYLPASKKGIVIGATLAFGAAGALITSSSLNYLLKQFPTWQTSFVIFAVAGLLILLFAFIYLPKQINKIEENVQDIWHDLSKIITNKEVIIYAFIAIGLFVPLSVMADLWGTAFLVKKFELTREVASPILMNIYIGMAIGSIILPYLAEKYNILDQVIQVSALILLILFAMLVYVPGLTYVNLVTLLILIGFFCGAEMLCFTAALRYTNSSTSGMTIGVVNTLNMLSGAIMQQVIGAYLDFTWHGHLDQHGLRIYSMKEFVEAFSILVIIIAICAIVAFLTLNNKKQKI